MKLFRKKNKQEAMLDSEVVEINNDKQLIQFLKNYVIQLDSLLKQQRLTEQDYQNELLVIENEVKVLEEKYL